MRVLAAAVICVIALGACKSARDYSVKRYDDRRAVERAQEQAATNQAAQEEAARPAPVLHGKGLPHGQKYRITDVWVTAFATDAKGKPWDDGTEADLLVKIRVDDRSVGECKPKDDARSAHCVLDLALELRTDSKIELEVIDRDPFTDDVIGTATIRDPSTWDVATELPMAAQRRVESAAIAIGLVPTWWELHSYRVLGLGIGVAFALLVLLLFRGPLLRKSEPETNAIWHVPLLVIAGLAAIAGVGVAIGVESHGLPEPYGSAVQWGLAAASLVFTLTRVIRIGRVGRRELELLLLASGIFVAQIMLGLAACVVLIAFALLLLGEL